MCLYNFGDTKAEGRFTVTGPEGWKFMLPATAEIAPGERKELKLELSCTGTAENAPGTVCIRGDFGAGGKPVLSLRFQPQ